MSDDRSRSEAVLPDFLQPPAIDLAPIERVVAVLAVALGLAIGARLAIRGHPVSQPNARRRVG